MTRILVDGENTGTIVISDDAKNSRLLLDIDFPDTSIIHSLVSRVRALFDLDSDPILIANSFDCDRELKKLARKHMGLRLPSGWDPFEVAISAILGQLVSVERGRALVSDLMRFLGKPVILGNGETVHLFPTPESIANSDLQSLKTTGARKQTLIAFSKAVAEKKISLESTQDVENFYRSVLKIKGIGNWTASYMALKVLRHTDAFPETDLILARALKIHSKEVIQKTSPWRAYTAILLWKEYAHSKPETKSKH